MQAERYFLVALVVGVVVLSGCVPRSEPYTVSAYNGIAHDQSGRVWLTGVTTLYGAGPPSTTTWVQVCTQDPMTTAPRLMCQRVQLLEGVVPRPIDLRLPDLDSGDPDQGDDEDDEEEDEDKATPKPKPQGHPLDPKNQVPADDDR